MRKIIFTLLAFFFVTTTACATGSSSTASTTTQETNMKIKIEITSESGNHTLTATLAENSSAVAFYEELQKASVTVNMHDYGNFEKVGSLPKSFPRNDTQITTCAGDIILYQGNQITIYYGTNSWNFTRLGKVDEVTQAELKKILDKGDVTAVFEIAD